MCSNTVFCCRQSRNVAGATEKRPNFCRSSCTRTRASGFGYGERSKQHAVDDAEDGAAGADAERQREDGHDGEARRPGELTDRVAHVAQDVGKHEQSSSSRAGQPLLFAGEAFEPWFDGSFVSRPGVPAVGEPDVLGHPLPVVYLTARVGVGVGFGRPAGERLAIEVFELCRELANDSGLAFRREARQAELAADERVPVTHRWSP